MKSLNPNSSFSTKGLESNIQLNMPISKRRNWFKTASIAALLFTYFTQNIMAQEQIPVSTPMAEERPIKPVSSNKPHSKKRLPLLGVLLDVGVPDGIGLSLAVRPLSWLRLHAGGTSDLISGGVRGGATFIVPVPFFIQPSATIEAGYQFRESSNWLGSRFSNNPYFSNPWLQQIGYTYVNGHLGLEIGNPRFTFYVHGGFSYINTVVKDFQLQLIAQSPTSPSLTISNPNINGIIPSAKLGFVVYFW